MAEAAGTSNGEEGVMAMDREKLRRIGGYVQERP